MFRHADNPPRQESKEAVVSSQDSSPVVSGKDSFQAQPTEASLKELIEKNLKWSQIIYEQNRKINSKLFWTAVSNWIRTLIILVPLILAGIFLPPIIKDVWSNYTSVFNFSDNKEQTTSTPNSLDSLFKLFNLDPAKQEQIKALLK